MLFRNQNNGEEMNVSNLRMRDGRIFFSVRGKGCGKKFFNRNTCLVLDEQVEDGTFLTVADEWEVVGAAKERKADYTPAPKAEKTEQPIPAESEDADVEDAKVVEDEAEQPAPQPTPAPQSNGDAMAVLGSLFNGISKQVTDDVMKLVKPLIANLHPVVSYEIKTPDGAKHKTKEGVFHSCFKQILTLISGGVAPYLHGKSGTGKTEIARQCAEALGLKLYMTTAAQTKFDILGYGNAGGVYVPTEFFKAFTEGGLFFFDEMDASDSNALVAVNNALSQGWAEFPVLGRLNAHKDFRVIGAGNTGATGATEEYTARNVLDAATLNRFWFIEIDYDSRIDEYCANYDKEIVKFAHELRKVAEEKHISIIVSYRNIRQIAQWKDVNGFTDEFILKGALFKSMERDEIKILVAGMTLTDNRWYKCMKQICAAA